MYIKAEEKIIWREKKKKKKAMVHMTASGSQTDAKFYFLQLSNQLFSQNPIKPSKVCNIHLKILVQGISTWLIPGTLEIYI